jgi:hypothetical protein
MVDSANRVNIEPIAERYSPRRALCRAIPMQLEFEEFNDRRVTLRNQMAICYQSEDTVMGGMMTEQLLPISFIPLVNLMNLTSHLII